VNSRQGEWVCCRRISVRIPWEDAKYAQEAQEGSLGCGEDAKYAQEAQEGPLAVGAVKDLFVPGTLRMLRRILRSAQYLSYNQEKHVFRRSGVEAFTMRDKKDSCSS
jgi:hypothetical protein